MTDGDFAGRSENGDSPDWSRVRNADEPFFRTIVEAIDDTVVLVDEEGTVAYASPDVERLVGDSAADVVGESLSTYVPEAFPKYRRLVDFFSWGTAEALDGNTFDVPVIDGDAERRWLSVSLTALERRGDEFLVGTVRDVSRRRERKRELEKYERIVETTDDGIYVLDENFTVVNVNEAVVSMTGFSREELIGSHASLLATEDLLQKAAELSAELLETGDETRTIVSSIATKDGGTIPIETKFSLYPFADGRYGQLGVVRDISDRKRYEETLTALHNSTRELLTADTESKVAELIAETATDVIELDGAAIYLFDPAENVLRPSASSAGDLAVTHDWPTVEPDAGGVPWRVFIDDQEALIDCDGGGDGGHGVGSGADLPIDSGLCVPLGDHGVFVVATADPRAIDEERETLVGLLAASAEEALSRLDREETIRDRDRRLERQNRQLRRLDRVNAIIREIDQALVEAESTDEIDSAVCDRLVDADRIAFAWVGESDPNDDVVRPRGWSGDGAQYLDDLDLSLDGPVEPSARAAMDGELTTVSDVGSDLGGERWRKAALSREYRSVLAVPLEHDDITHGVLTVYGTDAGAFEGMESVFSELGETIANAIEAVTTKRALLADTRTELGFRLDGENDVLQRFSREAGGPIEVEGVVPETGGTTRLYVLARSVDPDEFQAAFEGSVAVDQVELVAHREDSTLFEAVVQGPTALSPIVERGAKVRSVRVTAEEIRVEVEIPDEADPGGFVEFVRSRFDDAELVSKTDRDRPARTPTELRGAFEKRLTERQLEVLRVAFLRGFFEWPRESTGQEVADSLDVSQPTVNRHLRASQRKLLTMLLDGGSASVE
ncbi:PAS domain S-box protein [Halobaculum halobium]|uniref:PAS domain S-box protein n=1 Tax=Halobaculum halobium TaxID=3032281 RepID=A0ABD5TC07_9EURY|nr:PAS domain S-box protein [Halobaculum sp. SYNS20]